MDSASTAISEAHRFLTEEQAFHLGILPTEQAHPLTRDLSTHMARDPEDGLRALWAVDADLPEWLDGILHGDVFAELVRAFERALASGGSILFSGCGATGRLSLILEAAWRAFWRDQPESEAGRYRDRVRGMITGGDRALVRSVEGFEDYASLGRRQLQEYGIGPGDVVVAISEGGETSSVIGSAWQALDEGAQVFFLFNNPADLLCRHVERSRQLIEAPGVMALDLSSGPMAIAGSTRLQAVTMELAVLGTALDTMLESLSAPGNRGQAPAGAGGLLPLIDSLTAKENLGALAAVVEQEVACYRDGGRVTYIADRFLLDIMQDTTERAPTFSLPPFRRKGDGKAPPSWAFIKHPCLSTPEAWRYCLGHEPRGLDWSPEEYRRLGAPREIWRAPPPLQGSRLYEFEIGNEPDPSRQEGKDSMALLVEVGDERLRIPDDFQRYLDGFPRRMRLEIRPTGSPGQNGESIRMVCPMPPSRLRLWEHLAVKLVFNALSTATMVRMGYVTGNWMSRAEATNKKLVDRGIRMVAEIGGLPYPEACIEFHRTLEEIREGRHGEPDLVAPAMATLQRLGRIDGA